MCAIDLEVTGQKRFLLLFDYTDISRRLLKVGKAKRIVPCTATTILYLHWTATHIPLVKLRNEDIRTMETELAELAGTFA